jgi:hypothetical protein
MVPTSPSTSYIYIYIYIYSTTTTHMWGFDRDKPNNATAWGEEDGSLPTSELQQQETDSNLTMFELPNSRY